MSCVWSWLLLVEAPMANWSQVRGQTKNGSKDLMEDCGRRIVTLPGGSPGSTSGARPRRRTRKRAPGGRACHGAWPGTARRSDMAIISITTSPSRGLTTQGKNRWGRVHCQTGGSESRGSRQTRPRQQRLALGTWNVTSLGGKEPELVREVERYRLDLVGLTSTHSRGSGTLLLDRGWTLFFSGVAQGVRCREGVGILTSPRLSAAMLEFTPVDERVAYLCLRVIGGGTTLTVVCAYAPNRSSEYSAFLGDPEWSPVWGSCRELRSPTGRLQCARGQQWRYLEGRDWEEEPP